jgi:hypothetical protein
VIYGGDGSLCLANSAACGSQSVERLRRSHFVDKVQIDVKKRRPAGRHRDYVLVPNLLE